MDCPSEEVLNQFLRRQMPPDRERDVDAHISSCPSCRSRLSGLTVAGLPVVFAGNADVPEDKPAIPGYEILETIAAGGMGVVYKARQTRLDRVVALKMIAPAAAFRTEAAKRFRVEAEAVARLRHPNIVPIHDVGEVGGRPYLTMEYVGGSLADRLRGDPWSAEDSAHLAEVLARAIHEAHRAGVVHRDLKPANVLMAEDVPKIADFGLAKLLDASLTPSHSGAVVGTPPYMAPEQAEGKKDVGPAADVYGLGAILYECLTTRPPFQAATPLETLRQVVADEPVPPSQRNPAVPRDLETICLKCLQKDPHKRYPDAAALAEELRRFRAGESITARPTGRLERAGRWCRRHPAAVAALSALALGVALGIGVGFLARSDAGTPNGPSPRLATTADRTAAEFVRSFGERADVTVVVGNSEVRLAREQPLPEEPFQLVGIWLYTAPRFGDAELKRLLGEARLESLLGLMLDETSVTDGGLVHLAEVPNLKELIVTSSPPLTDEALIHIKLLTNIQLLNLNDSLITDELLKALAELPNLRFLYIKNTKITAEGVAQLAQFPGLESLDLRDLPVTEAALQRLQGLKSLREIYYRAAGLKLPAWEAFRRARPDVRINPN